MAEPLKSDTTQLLRAWAGGDEQALGDLLFACCTQEDDGPDSRGRRRHP